MIPAHGGVGTPAARNTSPPRHDRRSPATRLGRRILERLDKLRLRQNAAHDLPLHPDAAPMYDAQRAKPQPARFLEISFDHRLHVARRYGVEIENIGDGNADRLVAHTKALDFISSNNLGGS